MAPCTTSSRLLEQHEAHQCTYPAAEGKVTDIGLAMLEHVAREAKAHGAVVSLKDRLLLPRRPEQIAECVARRVIQAGCTKLHPRLNRALLSHTRQVGVPHVGARPQDPPARKPGPHGQTPEQGAAHPGARRLHPGGRPPGGGSGHRVPREDPAPTAKMVA